MPIRPENRQRYPADWKAISLRIREREGWRCKWCDAAHGAPHPITGSTVVLTVAHLNHTPEDCRDENLAALCQRCHLNYDRLTHLANARETRDRNRQQLTLVLGEVG
jgi:hypothetical protein